MPTGEVRRRDAVARAGHSAPFSLAIRRELGTVVVTVDGELESRSCVAVERVLTDLVEGQGNVRVVVDMRGARITESAA